MMFTTWFNYLFLFAPFLWQKIIADQPVCAPVLASSFWVQSVQPAQVNVTIRGTNNLPLGYIIYNYHDEDRIGIPLPGQNEKVYFCTSDTIGIGNCDAAHIGELLLPSESVNATNPSTLTSPNYPITYAWSPLPTTKNVFYPVAQTGIYCARFVALPDHPLPMTFSVQFQNSSGWLPAEYFPLLKLTGTLAILYAVALLYWLVLCYRHCRYLMSLQRHIGWVLALGTTEMLSSYAYYQYYNELGRSSWAWIWAVALSSAIRGTVALFFLLLASLGYGIVLASLEGKRAAVYSLTIIHLVFSILNVIATISGGTSSSSSTSSPWILFTAIPITITYTIFAQWILSALASTKEWLALRKQTTKLTMYRSMSRVLYGLFGMAAFLMLLAILVVFRGEGGMIWRAQHWRWLWFLTAGWPLVLTAIGTLNIAWIFRPRQYNRSWGLDELGDRPLDDEEIELEGRAEMALCSLRSSRINREESSSLEPTSFTRSEGYRVRVFGRDEEEDENGNDRENQFVNNGTNEYEDNFVNPTESDEYQRIVPHFREN